MKKFVALIVSAALFCGLFSGCGSSNIPQLYAKVAPVFIAGIDKMTVDEAKSAAEQNGIELKKTDAYEYTVLDEKWEAVITFEPFSEKIQKFEFERLDGNLESISITKTSAFYSSMDELYRKFDNLGDCEEYIFGEKSGIEYVVEKEAPVISFGSSISSSSAPVETKPVIETGVTKLYSEGFSKFYDKMGTMTFAEGKKVSDTLETKGYSVEIIEPSDTVLARIIITAEDGDILETMFAYDFRRADEADTLSLIEYKHSKYHICVSDGVHTSENKFEIGDPKSSKGFYSAKSLSECEKFMFGSTATKEETLSVTLKYGTLLDKRAMGTLLIIKAKIEPSYSNKATVDQNYYNIEDIIKKQGGNRFTEIQYWAVADMTSGSEQKVVSFTVPEATIKNIANGKIVANQIGNYVDDLFVHASLR